jgi:hypothetical protein
VVVVAFQITFRVEMYQNDIFYIFKKSFLRSASQNDPKYYFFFNFLQEKIKFFRNAVCTTFPNSPNKHS